MALELVVAFAPLPRTVVAPRNETPQTLPAQPAQQAHTEQNPIKAFAQDTFSDPVSVFTLCLVGSTILLWRATLKLAREGRVTAIEQTNKMERSAAAMEGVAGSMAINAAQIVQSVAFQRQFGQMQLRPYLTVLIGQGCLSRR